MWPNPWLHTCLHTYFTRTSRHMAWGISKSGFLLDSIGRMVCQWLICYNEHVKTNMVQDSPLTPSALPAPSRSAPRPSTSSQVPVEACQTRQARQNSFLNVTAFSPRGHGPYALYQAIVPFISASPTGDLAPQVLACQYSF